MNLQEIRKIFSELPMEDFALWFGLVFFRLALDISYEFFLNPVFKYDSPISFHYDVQAGRYILSLLVYALFVSVIKSKSESVTNVFLFMAAMFVLAPVTSQYGMDSAKPITPVLCAAMALLVISSVSEMRIPVANSIRSVPGGKGIAIAVSVMAVIYLVVWGYVSGAVSYLSFDVRRIYDFRDKAGALLDVGKLAYLNLWVYKVFTIFLICVCLQYRKFVALLLVLGCQVYFFGLTSHRLILFLPLISIGFWFYLSRFNQLYPMPYAAAAAVAIALLLYQVFAVVTLPEIVIRRAFYVPSGLIFEWFDYFAMRPHVYWADGLLASFSDNPYVRTNIPRLIGDYLVPGSNSAANTGLIASGFAHAGYIGVIFYSVILGLVLSVLNAVVKSGVPLWMVVALSMGPLRTAIADSDLLTSLLSHGLGLALLILWLYREKSASQVQLGCNSATC